MHHVDTIEIINKLWYNSIQTITKNGYNNYMPEIKSTEKEKETCTIIYHLKSGTTISGQSEGKPQKIIDQFESNLQGARNIVFKVVTDSSVKLIPKTSVELIEVIIK